MGTQVITRDSGRRLGVVGEVIVDIDRREVVALGLRDNPLTRFLPGLPRWMPLDRIRQVGDVILVDSADSLSEGFSADRYSRVINCQVITESGQQLGRVLGFSFDIETGELTTLVMGAVGVPLLGEGVLSTWEIPVDEIVSSGADRIIVYEGAEEKLKQLNSGFLEKLGVGGSSWEEQERERYRLNVVPVENQLASGQPAELEPRQLEARTHRTIEAEQPELNTSNWNSPGSRSKQGGAISTKMPLDDSEPYREPYDLSRLAAAPNRRTNLTENRSLATTRPVQRAWGEPRRAYDGTCSYDDRDDDPPSDSPGGRWNVQGPLWTSNRWNESGCLDLDQDHPQSLPYRGCGTATARSKSRTAAPEEPLERPSMIAHQGPLRANQPAAFQAGQ